MQMLRGENEIVKQLILKFDGILKREKLEIIREKNLYTTKGIEHPIYFM